MTWREFTTHLGGLSADSRFAMVMRVEDDEPELITDPLVAERAILTMFGR